MANKRLLAPLVILALVATSCTSTRTIQIETGMFENDPDKILGTYEAVAGRSNDEVLTKQDLERMGFDLKAPNVESIAGPIALKRIFGSLVFENSRGENSPTTLPEKFSDYRGFAIPYRNIVLTTDRIYFSTRNVFKQGHQLMIFVLFKGNFLCYHDIYAVKIDAYESRHAFAEAIFFIIKSPGQLARGVLNVLERYESPGLEPFVPIPIPP